MLASLVLIESVIRQTKTNVDIPLNPSTVKCSHADYTLPNLKILVPGLAPLTVLNHRNRNEGAPCVAAGECAPGNEPKDLLDASRPTETVPVRVRLTRVTSIDHEQKKCSVWLSEKVATDVRGIKFRHERTQDLGERAYEDCL